MIVTQLSYVWPREAQYSYAPDDYDGCEIEDLSLELSMVKPEVGETRRWEDKEWKIAQIQTYTSESSANLFCIATLTFDGAAPQRDPWDSDSPRLMYACFNGEDFVFGWPTHPKFLPKVGDIVADLEGDAIATIHDFEGAGIYEHVLVCWCTPAKAESSRELVKSA